MVVADHKTHKYKPIHMSSDDTHTYTERMQDRQCNVCLLLHNCCRLFTAHKVNNIVKRPHRVKFYRRTGRPEKSIQPLRWHIVCDWSYPEEAIIISHLNATPLYYNNSMRVWKWREYIRCYIHWITSNYISNDDYMCMERRGRNWYIER